MIVNRSVGTVPKNQQTFQYIKRAHVIRLLSLTPIPTYTILGVVVACRPYSYFIDVLYLVVMIYNPHPS